jgi:CHASE2 domain-containing sensor protein
MNKFIILSLGKGDLKNCGFTDITAQCWEVGQLYSPPKNRGSLPAAPDLAELHRNWQVLYKGFYQNLNWPVRLEIDDEDQETAVPQFSEPKFNATCKQLEEQINAWLNSDSFQDGIEKPLRTWLNRTDESLIIIETEDKQLRRFPWNLWKLFEDYPKAEVALSRLDYERVSSSPIFSTGKLRILGILGNCTSLDGERLNVKQDQALWEQFLPSAQFKFLEEPELKKLYNQLWEESWDILFFAGHSSSHLDDEMGQIYINQNPQNNSLASNQLEKTLCKAIARGLKLAIFNSCDGVELAWNLTKVHIPQTIVMREEVPNEVAQEFLKNFLQEFAQGKSLYLSVREARNRLESLVHQFPCATWLPVIYLNPAAVPITRSELSGITEQSYRPLVAGESDSVTLGTSGNITQTHPRRIGSIWHNFRTMFLISLAVTSLGISVRSLGWLEPIEIWAYDRLMNWRSHNNEQPDPRLLIVGVTEDDFQAWGEHQPLSDQIVVRLLKELKRYQPKVIGLDIYRDKKLGEGHLNLINYLQQQSASIVSVCLIPGEDRKSYPGYPPPSGISKENLGFTNFVKDPGEIVRRHLLAMSPVDTNQGCNTSYSLSLRLALRYLGIKEAEGTPQGLKLGSFDLETLTEDSSGYQSERSKRNIQGGYQVLLNYRSSEQVARQVTLTQILKGQFDPNWIKDKIVLIGYVTPSARDEHYTPYSADQWSVKKMSGVVIHAHMVSQLLSAVQEHRPILHPWSKSGETLWIWGWALIGGILACQFRSFALLVSGGLALGILCGSCFWFFNQAVWVPLIPSMLTLIGTGSSVVASTRLQTQTNSKLQESKL